MGQMRVRHNLSNGRRPWDTPIFELEHMAVKHSYDFYSLQNPSSKNVYGSANGAKSFNTRFTAVQRVINRFGERKVPNQLTVKINKVKSLREISETLTGILDTLRYMVCCPMASRTWSKSHGSEIRLSVV